MLAGLLAVSSGCTRGATEAQPQAAAQGAPSASAPAPADTQAAKGKQLGSLKMQVLQAQQKAKGFDFSAEGSALRSHAGHLGAAMAVTSTARGVHISREGEMAFELGVETTRIGRGELAAIDSPQVAADGQSLVLRHGQAVEERFLAGPLGLSQSFDLARRPAGRGPLSIDVAFDGLKPSFGKTSDQVLLRDAHGQVRAGYRDLVAVDATGRDLPAHMELAGSAVSLVIDDQAAVYPVKIDPVVWPVVTELTDPDSNGQNSFGFSVAISGNWAVVGAWGYPPPPIGGLHGRAHFFMNDGTGWTLQQTVEGGPADAMGYSVALDGDTAVLGAYLHPVPPTPELGAAYVYVRDASNHWNMQQMLLASDGEEADVLGTTVAVQGNHTIVGAPGKKLNGKNAVGAAYIFGRTGNTWTQEAKVVASDAKENDRFSISVAIDGDTAMAGSPTHSSTTTQLEGATYVFQRNANGTWVESQKLIGGLGAGQPADQFGASIALHGDQAMIGATGHNVGLVPAVGGVYVFRRAASTWTLSQTLVGNGCKTGDGFGVSVAFDGPRAVIGAYLHSVNSNDAQGTAHVFVERGTNWVEQFELVEADGAKADLFGRSVGISGNVVAVSIPTRIQGQPGIVYFFGQVLVSQGGSCVDASDCKTGHCADHICCDSECAGGVTDCQSCLSSETGLGAGVCGKVTAAAHFACRPAFDSCDLDEVCDGVATTCPSADLHNPDGQVCDDSDACTRASSCANGRCVGSDPVVCMKKGVCYKVGTCDPSSGVCDDPYADENTPCVGSNGLHGECENTGICVTPRTSSSATGTHGGTSGGTTGGTHGTTGTGSTTGDSGMGSTTSNTTSTSTGGCGCGSSHEADPAVFFGMAGVLAYAARRRRS